VRLTAVAEAAAAVVVAELVMEGEAAEEGARSKDQGRACRNLLPEVATMS